MQPLLGCDDDNVDVGLDVKDWHEDRDEDGMRMRMRMRMTPTRVMPTRMNGRFRRRDSGRCRPTCARMKMIFCHKCGFLLCISIVTSNVFYG
jgi:hypothetical protein